MGPHVHYGSHTVALLPGETALDALLRVGADIPFSCKGGVCHSCMVRSGSAGPHPEAQRGLPQRLVEAGYVLACKFRPASDVQLQPRRPEDMVTACMLAELAVQPDGRVVLQFEPVSEIRYQRGERLRLVDVDGGAEPELLLTSDPAADYLLQAELLPGQAERCPDWLQPERVAAGDVAFGNEFQLRGPFPAASAPATVDVGDIRPPAPDPALWAELGHGRIVRQVLEAFYAQVYGDAQLAPFFAGVTRHRSIDKQYSFLKQCMTGEKVYMGDRPRNAHHWMIVSHELFDHRQRLMVQTLRAHGLTPEQIARWTRYEEVFRPDIVKSEPAPRRIGGVDVMREGFDAEVLLIDGVCDYCGGEILAGTTVLYHLRLGKIGCPACTPSMRAQPSATPTSSSP